MTDSHQPFVVIGTENPTKVRATTRTLQESDVFRGATFMNLRVPSGVSEQPKSLEEIMQGALNRATAALHHPSAAEVLEHRYGIGIESGIMPVSITHTGYMDLCAVIILDMNGRRACGLSQAFECPQFVIDIILTDSSKTLNDGFLALGLTDNPNVGYAEGIISLLTRGQVTREHLIRDAVRMALLQFMHPALYGI